MNRLYHCRPCHCHDHQCPAYLALEEHVSTKEEINTAMKLGTNYPFGPFEWANAIGANNILNASRKIKPGKQQVQTSRGILERSQTINCMSLILNIDTSGSEAYVSLTETGGGDSFHNNDTQKDHGIPANSYFTYRT